MEGIKFIASQAKSIHYYKSLRSKILKCNANIFFNKQCLAKSITPNYAKKKFQPHQKLPKLHKTQWDPIAFRHTLLCYIL